MYIKALEIKDFKKFSGTHRVDFPADITVVKGKNESGKSTLLEALYAALFFDPTIASTPQYIKNLQSWDADKLYELKLFFEIDGENYILEKDFEGQRAVLKKEDGDVLYHDPNEISDFLKDNGGYKNKDIFGNVSVVKKDVLVLLDSEKKKIMESLQDMVSGASSVSVSALLKKLKSTADDIEKGLDPSRPVKNPGKVKMLKDRIEELEADLKNKRDILTIKEKSQTILRELKESLDKLNEEKEILEREYKANEEYFSAKNEKEKVSKELDVVMKDLEVYNKLDEEKEELNKKIKNTQLPEEKDFEEIESRKLSIKFNAEKLQELEKIINDLKEKHKKVYRPTKKTFLITCAALGLGGIFGFWYRPMFIMWAILAAFAAWMFISGKYHETTGIKKLEGERDKREEDLKKEGKALDKHLAKFGVNEVSELKTLNKEIHEAQNRVKSIDSEQKTLLRGRSLEQLKDQNKELHKQLGVQESRIKDEYRSSPPEPKRQREIEHTLDKLNKEIKKKDKEYAEIKAKVDMSDVSQEDVAFIEEKVSSLTQNMEAYKKRAKLYRIVHETLEEARTRSLSKTKEALQEMMSEYISEITGGRYTSLELTDEFDIRAYSPEKGDYVSSEELSTGTIDQLYIVARFALAQLLYKKSGTEEADSDTTTNRPLMIFDDPFGNFDEDRRDKAQAILDRLSKDFQILMLTCVSAYDEWGKVVEI